jgi:hypothetical protein
MISPNLRKASVDADPMAGNATDPVAEARETPDGDQHGTCGQCGAPIARGMRATRKWCSRRCETRHARGQPATPAPPKTRTYGTTLTHSGYSVEQCPQCNFPEADGGACAACGWTLPRPGRPGGWPLHPAGTVHGPVYDKQGRREDTQRQPAAYGAQRHGITEAAA